MKRNVKFNHSERRASKSSSSDVALDSPVDEKSFKMPPLSKKDSNGAVTRPVHSRTDTGASDWATDNEVEVDDKKVPMPIPPASISFRVLTSFAKAEGPI